MGYNFILENNLSIHGTGTMENIPTVFAILLVCVFKKMYKIKVNKVDVSCQN